MEKIMAFINKYFLFRLRIKLISKVKIWLLKTNDGMLAE